MITTKDLKAVLRRFVLLHASRIRLRCLPLAKQFTGLFCSAECHSKGSLMFLIASLSRAQKSYKYLGAIHIHSIFSDGTGNIEDISMAAKKAGLDWIIVTDHNSFEIEEGFYNGVCMIKGEEISPKSENHYLALGINEVIAPGMPSDFIEQVRQQGGFGFAAHPDERVNERKNPYPAIRWADKNITPDGVEIWNWFSQWADNLNNKNIFALAYSFLFNNKSVSMPYPETLTWWDSLNNATEKIVPAIGGVDAHALRIKDYLIPLTIFPYEKCFKTITNVLTFKEPLSEDFPLRKAQILDALKNGNNLIVNRAVSKNIPEINFEVESKHLSIRTKKKSSIRVLHNGKELCNESANTLNLELKEVGKYRVEIKIGKRGFAYTNPIVVSK